MLVGGCVPRFNEPSVVVAPRKEPIVWHEPRLDPPELVTCSAQPTPPLMLRDPLPFAYCVTPAQFKQPPPTPIAWLLPMMWR